MNRLSFPGKFRELRWFLNVLVIILGGIAIALGTLTTPSWAVDLAKQPLIDVNVSLSNGANELVFVPAQVQFTAGKRYHLHLTNPSSSKHYFTAKDFADAIWTQKVDAGNVEIKGAIHELELRSGTAADWVFVPVRSGRYRLVCTVPGHTEAGMVGTLTISP